MEAHGGRIRAESAGAGRGAAFTFTLPAASQSGDTAAPAAPEAGDGSRDPNGARVLVVDDDPNLLRFVRHALYGAGFVPLVAAEAQDLAQVLRTGKPRLVLLDLMLPGADGIELMQSVPELSDLPVIFISGYGRDETVARALDAGAADYIVKPFSATELAARVRAALRRHEAPGPLVLGDLAVDIQRARRGLSHARTRREVNLPGGRYAVTPSCPRGIALGIRRSRWRRSRCPA